MRHWCGKGVVEKDRKRGRCGRCGLYLWMPLPNMTNEERKRLSQSRGPVAPPSVEKILAICSACQRGRHKECDENILWFCTCYRARHDPKLLVQPEEEEEWEDFV